MWRTYGARVFCGIVPPGLRPGLASFAPPALGHEGHDVSGFYGWWVWRWGEEGTMYRAPTFGVCVYWEG
jgi:hypothetical protein